MHNSNHKTLQMHALNKIGYFKEIRQVKEYNIQHEDYTWN